MSRYINKHKILSLIKHGYTLEELINTFPRKPKEKIKKLYFDFRPSSPSVNFGRKNEEYLSEEEIIKGFKVDPSELKGWELEQFKQR